jgi:hypothetical protein
MDFLDRENEEENICIMNAPPSDPRARLGHCF